MAKAATKTTTKATKAPAAAGAKTDGIHKPVKPSEELAAIVGADSLPRSEVVSKVWEYIKKNDLQNPKDKRQILADDKLQKVFDSKKEVSMFEMNKHLSKHLS